VNLNQNKLARPTVMGCGLVALDIVVHGGQRVAYSGVGGTVGNVLAIMAGLGWHSIPMVRLGADHAGMRVLDELTALGVDTRCLALDRQLRTPVVYQFNDMANRHHSFSFDCPSCGTSRRFAPGLIDGIEARPGTVPQRGQVFFFDRLTASSVVLAQQARANGGLVVFEPSSLGQDRSLFVRAVRAAHVVKYSADRISEDELPSLREGFLEVQTLGARGLRFRMHSLDPSWVELPAIHTASVVDTAGAGDWCTAGFLHALARQTPAGSLADLGYNHVYAALRSGQAVAALNCQHIGARGLMREYDRALLQNIVRAIGESQDTVWCSEEGGIDGWFDRFASSFRSRGGQRQPGLMPHHVETMSSLCCDAVLASHHGFTRLQ
jgi:fructokinase